MLGLPYPGGPHVERAAVNGDPNAIRFSPPHGRAPKPGFFLLRPEDGGAAGGGTHRAADRHRRRRSLRLVSGRGGGRASSIAAAPALRLLRAISPDRRQALVAAGGVAANGAHPPRADAFLRRMRLEARVAAAGPLHRQWRHDRLGRARALAARPHRRHGLRRAAALAARSTPIPVGTAKREAHAQNPLAGRRIDAGD